jgi:hypothetical protein
MVFGHPTGFICFQLVFSVYKLDLPGTNWICLVSKGFGWLKLDLSCFNGIQAFVCDKRASILRCPELLPELLDKFDDHYIGTTCLDVA